jgi:uncharacterized membrane protein YdbT with pleckstrin-like domain
VAYPQKLLSDGEHVVRDMRPHWRSLVMPVFWLLVVIGLGSYLAAKFDSTTLRWIILAVAVVALVWFVIKPFLTWLTTEYVITDRRLITRTGMVARSGRDIPLSKVNDVRFSYTVIERILGCGTLVVESAGEHSGLVIASVAHVEDIQREISHLREQDDQRRRRDTATGGYMPAGE